MHILLLTFGSTGDVQPFVALGKGLKARGHDVTVCANGTFEALITGHGLDYAHLNDGITEVLESQFGRKTIETMSSFWGGLKTVATMPRKLGPLMWETLSDTWTAAETVRPDLIVYYPKAGAAPHFAEKLGIPVVAAPLFPQFVSTGEFPSLGFPALRLGRGYNRLTYRIVMRINDLMSGKHIRRWRLANGLPAKSKAGLFRTAAGDPIPVIHGYSRHVAPEPVDWPGHVTATGFWFLGQNEEWEPSRALVDFLDAGDPPVYVGFGSMAARNPKRVTETVIQALAQAGVRGIIAKGWGGLNPNDLPDSILTIDRAPHNWLFPRMAAVVHHGGAGTTAAGLRAGCPTVVCPFFGDQPFWGARVHVLGAGPKPSPQKKLTPENLSAAIREAVSDPAMRAAAEAVGEKLRAEDGIANAVGVVDRAGGVVGGGQSPDNESVATYGLH
ncbi:MAG: glycosyltransferase [Gemmatimonadota bacterium]